MRVTLLFLLLAFPAWGVASFEAVKQGYGTTDYTLLDRNGAVLQKTRATYLSRQLSWVPLDEVSPRFVEALLYLEDRRFWRHGGVDFPALAKAMLQNVLRSQRHRGASTIPMQLAGLLDPNLRPRRGRRSFWQKIVQMRSAWDLERTWTKAQILEAYVNLVSFQGEKRGIRAASQLLLGKDPHGVTSAEAFYLASRIRAPAQGEAQQKVRACRLYRGWTKGGECAEVEKLFGVTAEREPSLQSPSLAYHLLNRLKGGAARSIATSLDRATQEKAIELLQGQLGSLREKNVRDGAVLVIENQTGLVRAYVANSGEGSSAKFVDGILALRQAGSTLKPIVFASAFEKGILTPESLLEDSPVEIAVEGGVGVYRPQNYDNQFHGWVTARESLASSLNVPAVKVFLKIGAEALVDKLTALGFSQLRRPEDYGPSLALGSADISLWELTNAYRTLANGGAFHPASFFEAEKAEARKRVFPPDVAEKITAILSDRQARSLTFGLENALATRGQAAVKTGTSQDMRDNWCLGYGKHFTVGVWVGNLTGEPMWNVSGVTGAAPIWAAMMDFLEAGGPLKNEGAPTVARSAPRALSVRKISRLLYPTDGLILALDPDIPPGRQKIFFEVEGKEPGLRVELTGETGKKLRVQGEGWVPEHGVFQAVLKDGQGRVRDKVAFEVRGRISRGG